MPPAILNHPPAALTMTTTKQLHPMTTGIEILQGISNVVAQKAPHCSKEIDLLSLKIVFSHINGCVTILTSIAFVERIYDWGIIDENQKKDITKQVLNTSPYANGYDINGKKIVAEVKCNIPVGKNRFGAAQIKALKKDVDGLINETKDKISDKIKFLVMLGNIRDNCFKDALAAFIEGLKKESQNLVIVDNHDSVDRSAINVVVIHPSEITFKKLNDVVNNYQH